MKTILTLLLLISTTWSYSCDCVTTKGLKDSDIVFRGKVVEIKRIDSIIIYYSITFEVDTLIKAPKNTGKKISLSVNCLNEACCGLDMSVNEKYEVYAYYENRDYGLGKMLHTGFCTETSRLK